MIWERIDEDCPVFSQRYMTRLLAGTELSSLPGHPHTIHRPHDSSAARDHSDPARRRRDRPPMLARAETGLPLAIRLRPIPEGHPRDIIGEERGGEHWLVCVERWIKTSREVEGMVSQASKAFHNCEANRAFHACPRTRRGRRRFEER